MDSTLMPIERLQLLARKRTRELLHTGCLQLGLCIEPPEIRFDLSGKTAGMLLFPPNGRCAIRYNLPMLMKYGEDFINTTIPHEVSHLIARSLHGPRIRPHGSEWKRVMALFGAQPVRCHGFSTEGTGERRLRTFSYRCDCRDHSLSAIRHNRILRGRIYLCRYCGTRLR